MTTHNKGKRISQDVAVVGFAAAYLRPTLTTLELPHYTMGQWAVQYLLEAHTAEDGPVQAILPCPVIIRASS